jgi:hypothetical protein
MVLVLAVLLYQLASASFAAADEPVQPHFDERQWVVGYNAHENSEKITEYILQGESVDKWSELITIYENVGLQKSVKLQDYVLYMEKVMAATCPMSHWNIIQSSDESVVYEWSVRACAKAEDQTELARAILGKDGITLVRYTVKQDEISQAVRQKWINILNSIKIEN